MLRLLLLRHAKSDWNHPGLRDHDRPLAPRGLRNAPRLGRYLREQNLVPAVALVSTARRARMTAELALEAAGAAPEVMRLIPDLYGSSPDEIVEIVAAEGGDASPLLVVAHNPGMEDLVARLGGRYAHFPTAALAIVSVPGSDWTGISVARATLDSLVRPRELPRGG
ncbi:MAG: histidine phosphatase family protein [Acidobacteria bacterium]|nr:histidine phosphatase family protein [Acidobacteriota bacterium]